MERGALVKAPTRLLNRLKTQTLALTRRQTRARLAQVERQLSITEAEFEARLKQDRARPLGILANALIQKNRTWTENLLDQDGYPKCRFFGFQPCAEVARRRSLFDRTWVSEQTAAWRWFILPKHFSGSRAPVSSGCGSKCIGRSARRRPISVATQSAAWSRRCFQNRTAAT